MSLINEKLLRLESKSFTDEDSTGLVNGGFTADSVGRQSISSSTQPNMSRSADPTEVKAFFRPRTNSSGSKQAEQGDIRL